MKALNLKLAHVLIKISLVFQWIFLFLIIVGTITMCFNGKAFPEIFEYLPKVDSTLNELKPTFWNILPFAILLIIRTAIVIFILKKSSEVIGEFREGLVFNSKIGNKIKTIANWVVILVIIKIVGTFILQLIIFGIADVGISSGLGTTILITTMIYITADIIKKGADLKSENDLTI